MQTADHIDLETGKVYRVADPKADYVNVGTFISWLEVPDGHGHFKNWACFVGTRPDGTRYCFVARSRERVTVVDPTFDDGSTIYATNDAEITTLMRAVDMIDAAGRELAWTFTPRRPDISDMVSALATVRNGLGQLIGNGSTTSTDPQTAFGPTADTPDGDDLRPDAY